MTEKILKQRPLQQLKAYFVSTWKGLSLAWRASPRLGVIITVLTTISSLLPPAMAYVGKLIIDAVVAQNSERTIKMVLIEFGLIALTSLVLRVLFLSRTLLGNRLGIEVNAMILQKSIELDLAQIENSEFYDKLTRARREASSRSLQMVTDSFQFVQNLLTLLGYITLLFAFSPWAVFALIIASIPATISEMVFATVSFQLYNWRSQDRRRMSYMEYVIATDSHAKELRIFNLGGRFLNRYRSLAETFYKEETLLSKRRTMWIILLSLLSSGAFYGCYLMIAIEAATGGLSLGNLSLYVVVFRQGQQAFQSCLTAIGGLYENNLYLSNLFEFLNIPQNSSAPKRASALLPVSAVPKEGIFFDRVSFKYPNRDKWALREITLHIPQGQSTAVVGSNGAGKSTLIKLLCGLYQPNEGCIYLDGIDLRDWAPEKLLPRISIVFQDFNKYQLSIQENVGVGEEKFLEDEGHIHRAMDKAGASELMQNMPDGLKTSLGTWFKGGVELSGGQWQKIAVSRAFMRDKADILILDEPTAALDPEAESLAFEKFHDLTIGKTSLIISHRFPIARLADHIVVIEEGQIKEEGSHEELVTAKGRYARLFQMQAKGYT